jgi:type III secretion protein T
MHDLLGPLANFNETIGDVLLLIGLCSIRVMAALFVLPATGSQVIQGRVRASLVVMLGAFIAFGVPRPPELVDMEAMQWLGLAAKEVLIGVALGFGASTVFWTAECVGAMMDTQTGYNNVQITNPLSGQASTPISGLLVQLVIAVFWVLGGMLIFIGALMESFRVWPLFSTLPSLSGTAEVFLIQQGGTLLVGVVKFAAPVMLILVLIDVGFGLITRTAGKLEPASLSQPVKGAVTVLLLAFLAGIFIDQVRHLLLPTDLIPRMQSMFRS